MVVLTPKQGCVHVNMSKIQPVVAVLLSTFNGALYLPEFLASLTTQRRPPDRLVFRDDGSQDASPAIVQSWAREAGIELEKIVGLPLGPSKSFLTMLATARPADVTMLADQDDVWLPEKIARAVGRLPLGLDARPTLYASALRVTDAQLRPLRDTEFPRHLGFASAACESVLTGCTMALNPALAAIVRAATPTRVQMHDWWLYMLATATGDVVFDPEPTILYRQHGMNAVGAAPTGWRSLRARTQRLGSATGVRRSEQLAQLLALHEASMRPEAVQLAQLLAGTRSSTTARVRAAVTAPLQRQSGPNLLTTRIAILTNYF